MQEPSGKKGGNFGEMHQYIMILKAWLRGMHHSIEHSHNYLDESSSKYSRSTVDGTIFENLLLRTVQHQPVFSENMNIK
ncbi:MAG: hypothetical protein ACJARG_000398 [Arcticibacterium sp.]|jgi:hypothetical protein